ncbi:MAG: putative toxin-antitoxin system toxin component, PIN family [Opitutaceae bacterium]
MSEPPVWVLDTNVLVSAFLGSSSGAPARLWDALLERRWQAAVSPPILAEYRDVLTRRAFRLDPEEMLGVVEIIALAGVRVHAPPVASILFPDPDDAVFLGAALGTSERALVTGNAKHYPPRLRQGVEVLTPRQALARLPA